MESKEKIHGFILKDEKFIKEINANVRIMEHEQSGAKLMHIPNDDPNKTFAITFRTPPMDDTGLPHILEHAVLCGSRKFPCKEPFVELAKGSLNTYLNAMTFSDKTMYPISSQNDKDFVNLMDVYLDAVFYPNIYDNPFLLAQEGWSYKIDSKDDKLEYQGVVYNEMKGAFASPEGFLFRKIKESLFPDTIYKYESGGDPSSIPNLTQEQFIDYHKNYYHPSNSYICLYGNGDIDEHLKLIDEDYLSNFTKIDIDSSIDTQKPFDKRKDIEIEYPISADEDTNGKTYLAMNFVIGNNDNQEVLMAVEILEHLLLDTPAAPLKKAIIDAGVGQDVFGIFSSSLKQPTFSIIVKNSSPDKKELFEDVVNKTLNNLVKNGLDKESVEGAINTKEFELREGDSGGYSKGLFYSIDVMKTWLYDGNPYDYLEYEQMLANLKKLVSNGYLEDIIKRYILDNTHSTMITMKPIQGLTEKEDLKVQEQLEKIKESWTEEELEKVIAKSKKLQSMQMEPDKKEDLEKIPTLELSDLDKEINYPTYSVDENECINTILVPQDTNKIAYINLFYDISGVDIDSLPYITILTNLIGKIDTKNYTYEELNKQIEIYTGGIQFSTQLINDAVSYDEYKPQLVIRSKVLYNKMPYLNNILKEMILNTKFDNPKRILEIIREMKSRIEMSISQDGHRVAINRLMSYFTDKGKYNEKMKGFEFYKFLCNLEKDFEANEEEVLTKLQSVYNLLSNRKRMTIGITCHENEIDKVKDSVINSLSSLDSYDYSKEEIKFDTKVKNEGLLAPFNIQYVSKGYNFKKLGYEYSGSMAVLKNILALDYLWNNVRVQNGAYGCFAEFGRNGTMFFASYRDPKVDTTLNIYDNAYKFIDDFNPTNRDMVKYIIGTISSMDFPLTPSMKGEQAQRFYFSNITREMLQKEREEVLSTTKDHIKELSKVVYDCMNKDYICVVGNKSKIEESKDKFEHFIDIFE